MITSDMIWGAVVIISTTTLGWVVRIERKLGEYDAILKKMDYLIDILLKKELDSRDKQ